MRAFGEKSEIKIFCFAAAAGEARRLSRAKREKGAIFRIAAVAGENSLSPPFAPYGIRQNGLQAAGLYKVVYKKDLKFF